MTLHCVGHCLDILCTWQVVWGGSEFQSEKRGIMGVAGSIWLRVEVELLGCGNVALYNLMESLFCLISL